MNLILVTLAVFVINIPFGYWRANVKKFSVQWFLSIHVPIPFVVLLRIYGGIGFALYTYPIIVAAFFGGQFYGKILFSKFLKKADVVLSSCLVMDLFNLSKKEK